MLDVALLIVKCKDQFLLCKRSIEQNDLPGYWSCPGGYVEVGDTVWIRYPNDEGFEVTLDIINSTDISFSGSVSGHNWGDPWTLWL